MIVTSKGIPVEFSFTTGNAHHLDGLKQMPVNLPQGSQNLADWAYTDYLPEEMLAYDDIQRKIRKTCQPCQVLTIKGIK